MIAGGTESMSMVPMMGNKPSLNARIFERTRTSPSPTAWASPPRTSRSSGRSRARTQDAFALAVAPEGDRRASQAGEFKDEITPYRGHRAASRTSRRGEIDVKTPQGATPTKARAPTPALEALAKLKPGVRRQGQRHRRQQLADVRRRRRGDADVSEKRAQAVQPEAAGALRRLRGRGRAARDHGHRPDGGDPEGARSAPASSRTTSTGSSSTKLSPRRRWR